AGYDTGFILGYPYTSALPGTAPMYRWYLPRINDHITARDTENIGAYGYLFDGVVGYGYRRFRNLCESRKYAYGSQVTVAANMVAGGALSELWWGGKQFVNAHDFGRYIQIALNLAPTAEVNTPTEAGSYYGCPKGAAPFAPWAQGSPIRGVSVS